MITKNDAIRELYAGPVSFNGNGVVYHGGFPEPSEEEIQAKLAELQAAEPMRILRAERDKLISQTDWWCVSDRTPTNEQLIYRQQLRDLPANSTPALDADGNLTGVDWPTPPTS